MSTTVDIAIYLIRTLAHLYLLVVMLRFLLQLVRADFYNPISQFIAKATNPLLIPLRRIIPGLGGFDLACLVLALLLQWAAIQLMILLLGHGLVNPLTLLLWGALGIVSLLIGVYFVALLVVFIASWVAPYSRHPALMLVRQLAEPVLAPFRRIIPPIGGLDLSLFFAVICLNILYSFLMPEAISAARMSSALELGIVPGFFR